MMASDDENLSSSQKVLILDIERQLKETGLPYLRTHTMIYIADDDKGFPNTKEVLEMGICLIERGFTVRPFKKGILIDTAGYRGRN